MMEAIMRVKFPVIVIGILLLALFTISGCNSRPQPTESPVSPLSTPVSTAAAQSTSTKEISSPSATSDWVTDTPDPAEAPVIISEVTRTEDGVEIILITNISSIEQSLKDRTILDPQTMEYVDLPQDVVVAPGETFKVYNGVRTPEETDGFVWREEPVLQSKGDQLVLVNQAGRVLWNYVNPRDYP
jgi:hypothetical protein